MILHLFTDDPKFTELAIDIFTQTGVAGRYIIFSDQETHPLSDREGVKIINPSDAHSWQQLIESAPEYSLIVLHNLFSSNRRFLKELENAYLPQCPPIAWVFWGAELYGYIEPAIDFLGKETKKLYKQKTKQRIIDFIKHHLYNRYNLKKMLGKAQYICSYIPQDIDRFNQTTHLQLKPLWFTYYPIEKLIDKSIINKRAAGIGNILIGNSGNYTNNHLDSFSLLKEFDLTNRQIIVPVSYGGDPLYCSQIIEQGKKYFGDQFNALTSFVPREKYNQILLSCTAAIFNTYRQQAMGNIITALWLGIRTYLNNFTTSYQYLEGLGLHIFNIQDDLTIQNTNPFICLSDQEIEENRTILFKEFGQNTVIKKVESSFKSFN